MLPGMTKLELLAAFAKGEIDSGSTAAKYMSISRSQADRHIRDLHREGYLEIFDTVPTKGRPIKIYCIASKGAGLLARMRESKTNLVRRVLALEEQAKSFEERLAALEAPISVQAAK
jgi:predicted ArsR family transcriptional regulator